MGFNSDRDPETYNNLEAEKHPWWYIIINIISDILKSDLQ